MKISLENLSLQYGGVRVVKELDLDIADGESLVLLGQSGCGKTSTMRCIAGLEQPSGGRITIGDPVVHDSERGTQCGALQTQCRHGLPVLRRLAPSHRLRERRLPAADAEGAQGRGDHPGPRGPRPRRAVRVRRPRREPALRRPDAARRAGPQPRHAAQRPAARRAAVQPGRPAARTAAHRTPRDPARPGPDHRLRHPRPDRGASRWPTASR